MPERTPLDNISIVLVDTKTPGNIGATARSMMNMGLRSLILVNPPSVSDRDAYRLAAGAERIIERASVFTSLSDAVADHGLVVGTSRHAGRLRKNIHSPRAMAQQLIPVLANNRIAIVFGNEVNGLERRDLALCQEIIAIPSSDAFPSLNLSHAVIIVAYELYLAADTAVGPAEDTLASSAVLENLYSHLQTSLQTIGFLDRDHPDRLMFTIRQIFGRARLTVRDVAIFQGILSAMERAAGSRGKG